MGHLVYTYRMFYIKCYYTLLLTKCFIADIVKFLVILLQQKFITTFYICLYITSVSVI